ncbi:MAG TPA: hypothetical protein VGK18_03620 [Propionicimonas sp.]|uniref:hypothetical protein n=1 Tax=Propionicimonas sp. TaxID=1955623 RepID=UPI002F42F71E
MPTTILATALPYSLADDAPFQLSVFFTHKLTGGQTLLSAYPAAADWVGTLAGCTLTLTTSLDPATPIPLRVVSTPDAAAWSAVLPPDTPVDSFPEPKLSDETWRTNPASRMSDHAVDLHLAAVTAAPTHRPALAGDPVAGDLLQTLASLDQDGPLSRLLREEPVRARRDLQLPGQRLRDALTTLGPLTGPEDADPERGHRGEIGPPPPYQSEIPDVVSPIQILLDDPEADNRVTGRLDGLVGQNLSANPGLQLIVDAHAMRRYYERPEQPQQEPRTEPRPGATPPPRPDRPSHDFHAKVGSFGSTPALLRSLGLAVDVVLEGLTPAAARRVLAGATWVSVGIDSPAEDLEVLTPRRTAVTVGNAVFRARSSDAWVGGAVPLGDDDWVVLDTDPDASGLKLDQHTRNLARQYASEANGDPATSAPGTLRATGFAIARRERADQLRARVKAAEAVAADDGTRELLLDDLVRGIRVEVWDDATKQWHSLHRRLVTVTARPGGQTILTDAADTGFLQLSALNTGPGGAEAGYYVHEVVAGWDGWSLSAPRPGLTIVHLEPPDAQGNTEAVVAASADQPLDGAQVASRVAPASLPRLRYGMSYSFRVLAVDLAGNSVPQAVPPARRPARPARAALAAARSHLERLQSAYRRRDGAGIASALARSLAEGPDRREAFGEHLPVELLSGDERIDATLRGLVAGAVAASATPPTATQRAFDDVATAARILAASPRGGRVRPQLRIDAADFAALARNDDLQLSDDLRLPTRSTVTVPRPYLRWEPVPAPAIVPRKELGTGEQPAVLVVRTGADGGAPPDARTSAERHLAAPKATQLEAEAAGLFDPAIGTGTAAEIKRLYAIALAERGTLMDQFVPSLTAPRAVDEQPGIALADRPGADTTSPNRATLATITDERGRPIGEGQYVVHDTDKLRLPYLPDPYAAGVSLVFYEAGAPHQLAEPRALQAVSVPYPGEWPSLQPLRLVLEPGAELAARVEEHVVYVTVPPGEQVRAALASTVDVGKLDNFGLWRSHLASVADPADGFSTDEVVASAALQRAAASGWTWWLTPSTDVRLVHAVPVPVRPPRLSALSLFLRPPSRSVAALTGLVDVHGPSTDLLLVTARWSETVDDPATERPKETGKSDVVVRSTVGERERTGVGFLYDFQPTGALAQALDGVGFHKFLQTFEDTHYRRVTYVPSGTTRYAEYFPADQVPADPPSGEPVVLDIPSSARPAAPVVLDAVPLLRWEARAEPAEPFAWRQVRRAGVRVWLARPWYSSGDGELLGVLVFDTREWVQTPQGWVQQPKALQAPDAATSLWAADPIVQEGGGTTNPTVPPLLAVDQLLLDLAETGAAQGVGIRPPLHGEVFGGRDRGWTHEPGNPVAVAPAIALRDVHGNPSARVLAYQPEFDEKSRRWFVDINVQETNALWPFLRLAVARYQQHSIEGCELSPVALTGWVQPLPTRTLTVSRPDAGHVQVTLTGVVNWLRQREQFTPDLPGDQLSADSPTGAARERASRLQQSRTVRASVQHRPEGAGDLEWELVSWSVLLAVSVEESGGYHATWTGAVVLPAGAGTPEGDEAGLPGLRRPGTESSWRVLVEEHELLDADPEAVGGAPGVQPRLVYADEVWL